MYPDQSLYPANSVPDVVRRTNQALLRADQIHHSEGDHSTQWLVPLVADAESGFGGALNCFELTKAMIEAGTAALHFEDQLSSEKKCGHMGGKVLLPTSWAVRNLVAARLAADVERVPTVIIARTDALDADLLVSDVDEADRQFLTGERTEEGFYRGTAGMDQAISLALAFPPTPTSSGARRRTLTWTRPSASRPPCTSGSPARRSPTTAPPPSTGRRR
jgi:isocitrate/methylisocitrate lyase